MMNKILHITNPIPTRRKAGNRNRESQGYFKEEGVSLARFISADTIVPEPGGSQGYDQYAYSSNNPVKSIDPSGHRPCDDGDLDWRCDNLPGGGGTGNGGGSGGGSNPPTVTYDNPVTYVQGYTEETLASAHQYQGKTPFCGPYSLAIATNLVTGNTYTGLDVNDVLVMKLRKFKKSGIPGIPLAYGIQLLLSDYEVAYKRNGTLEQLKNNVDDGFITLVGVSWQTTGEILELMFISNPANDMMNGVIVGHWMVVAGYNETSEDIILIDPAGAIDNPFTSYSYTDFLKYWTQKSNLFIGSGDFISIK
ncbi:MAG: hypothetical protein ABFC97_02495 [Anaerolineaceae bacterium]